MANRLDTPSIPTELANEESQSQFSEAVKECVEVLEGKRGDGMDRALTPRDLAGLGMITVSEAATISGGSSSGVGIGVPPAIIIEVEFPTTPVGLTASGAFTGILLTWTKPTFQGYAHTEIWRYDANSLASAVQIATSSFNVYSDPVEPDSSFYYWIRFVNTNDQKGDYNQTSGTLGETVKVVSKLIGAITQSHFQSTLSTEIDAIAINGTSISTEVTNRIAAITGEAAARTNAISSLAASVADITGAEAYDSTATFATNDLVTYNSKLYKATQSSTGNLPTNTTYWALVGNYSSIGAVVVANASAVSDLDTRVTSAEGSITSQSTDITALETTVNDSTTGVAATASGLGVLETTVSTQGTATTTNATDITALETTVNHGTTGVAASASGLSTLETTVTSQGTAITSSASDITTLNTTVAGNSSSIQTHTGSINGISAEKFVKVDVNGNVAGYGIYNSASGSEFAVNANVFKIANGASRVVPFSVVNGSTYINTALIADASIDVAKISNLTVDMAQVTGTLTANKIGAGLITSDKISAAGIGADKITMDGNIEFANNNSGVQSGKTSLGDTQAGAFFGRSGGVAGFSIASSTSGIYADSAGTVALNNVRLYSGVAGTPFEYPNTGTYTANISNLTSSISVIIIGGGGGACNNATSGTSTGNTYKRAGTSGTDSYIKWYSGLNGTGTLLGTYTGTGGAGLAAGSVGSNTSYASGTTGQASSKAAGGSAGTYGYNYSGALPGNGSFGSGGGGAANGSTSSGTPNAPVNQVAGAGGTISQLLTKPSGAQSIKIHVGTGGTGGAAFPAAIIYAGGNGGNGFVSYADPNSGGIEIDLTAILNRLTALEA
tara:strand:- start:345 stop:2876 length:2532 start_codon:yes stop_codon:yes gene_type:complete